MFPFYKLAAGAVHSTKGLEQLLAEAQVKHIHVSKVQVKEGTGKVGAAQSKKAVLLNDLGYTGLSKCFWDFPVVHWFKNPSCNAGNAGSISSWELKSHPACPS